MSDTALQLVPLEEEDLSSQALKLRLQGMSGQQIARKLMVPIHEVNRALDAILPSLDSAYRRRTINESLLILDMLIGTHMQSIKNFESASIVIRALCEKRFWTGIVGSSDPVQLVEGSRQESSLAAWKRGLAALERQMDLLVNDGKPTLQSNSPNKPADAPTEDTPTCVDVSSPDEPDQS